MTFLNPIFTNPVFILAFIAFAGVLCQWVAWKIRLPAILLLLLLGLLLGPVTKLINPEDLIGSILHPLIFMAVSIILFEGSLTLNFREIAGLQGIVRRLVSVGAILSLVLVSFATVMIMGFSGDVATLFSAIVVVTGPTVIQPILKTVRPNARIGSILKWEGILIDPIGAVMAILVFQFVLKDNLGSALFETFKHFFWLIFIGITTGIISGWIVAQLFRRHIVPDFLQNFMVLALILITFAISNIIAEESGLLAVTIMGIYLANVPDVNLEELLSFKENLSVLLISGLFIILAALVDFDKIIELGLPALGLLAVIQFIIRPLIVGLCALGTDLNWREILLIGWIGPRGIVAAAVSGLFALKLSHAGIKDSEFLVPLTFIIIIGTVLFQSLTAGPLARLLKVAQASPNGLLIIGANPAARAIGAALQEEKVKIILVTTDAYGIRKARMENLPVFYGHPVSERAENYLDLTGLGTLLSMSSDRELNALSAMHYRHVFSSNKTYSLPIRSKINSSSVHRLTTQRQGIEPFHPDLSLDHFLLLLRKGAKIRRTELSDSFTYKDIRIDTQNYLFPLFAIYSDGRVLVFSAKNPNVPETGYTLISLDYSATGVNFPLEDPV